MMTSSSTVSTFPAALPQSGGGRGAMQRLLAAGEMSAQVQLTMPMGQGSEPQPALLFSALLDAAIPQAAPETPGLALIELATDGPMSREAALAGLSADTDEILAGLMAMPGMIDLPDAVAQFVELLQQFDLETGGNASEVLARNLAALDARGLARLDAAASNPLSLLVALARLAGIPGPTNPGTAPPPRIWQENPTPDTRAPSTPAPPSMWLHGGDGVPSGRGDVPSFLPVPEAFALQKLAPSPVKAPSGVRALVAEAMLGARTGAEREGVPLFASSVEARAVAGSVWNIARPAEPGPPPNLGFARNIVQQIRGASFIDGHTRIALAPRGLGEIEIDLRTNESGQMRIVLRAENPAVLQALRGDRDGLLLALSDGSAGAEDADLEFEDFSRRQRRDTDRADASPDHPRSTEREDTARIIAPAPRIIGTGTLDMLT